MMYREKCNVRAKEDTISGNAFRLSASDCKFSDITLDLTCKCANGTAGGIPCTINLAGMLNELRA